MGIGALLKGFVEGFNSSTKTLTDSEYKDALGKLAKSRAANLDDPETQKLNKDYLRGRIGAVGASTRRVQQQNEYFDSPEGKEDRSLDRESRRALNIQRTRELKGEDASSAPTVPASTAPMFSSPPKPVSALDTGRNYAMAEQYSGFPGYDIDYSHEDDPYQDMRAVG